MHIIVMICNICVAYNSLAVVVIGFVPVLYTVEEDDPTGAVDVTIHLLEGDLTGLTFSTAIPVDVSAEGFTATGLCLSYICQHFIAFSGGGGGGGSLFPFTHTPMPLPYHHK